MQMQASKAAPKAPSRMVLGAVVKGKIAKPMRLLVHGVEGVGKSTLAADAPDPIFLGAEDGTSELDTSRLPEPHTWQDALDAVAALTTEEHSYRTLAIDTLDWLEPLCWAHVCAGKRDANGKPYESIEDFGYGKGYTAALDEWRVFFAALDALRAKRGMHVIALAHTWIKPFKNPSGDDFDRYELKLHAKTGGLVKEWVDAVLFANFETFTTKEKNRVRGVSTGARVLYTQRTAAYDAKNRYDLPETLPLSWEALSEAIAAHRPADPSKTTERIETLLAAASEPIRVKVRAAVARAEGNAAELARIADKLAATMSIESQG